jgi:hypothetical protein
MTLVLLAWIVITLVAWAARGADLSKGYTFTATDHVTSTKLNNLVDAAVINSSFITGQSAGTPAASDSFIFYSVSGAGFRKCTLSTLTLDNPALITGQSEDTTPVINDWLLTYDTSASSLKKIQLNSIFTNAVLINGRTNWATPDRNTAEFLGFNPTTGAFFKTTRSNLFYQFFEFNTWTNQPTTTTPTNADLIPIFKDGTNQVTSVLSLWTNLPVLTTNTLNGLFITFTNGIPYVMTLSNLQNSFLTSGAFLTTNLTFTSSGVTLSSISGAGVVLNVAHNLGTTPRFLRAEIVCLTADNGYAVGDRNDVSSIHNLSAAPPGNFWCNATNVGFTAYGAAANWQMYDKSSGASVTPTGARWELRLTARP